MSEGGEELTNRYSKTQIHTNKERNTTRKCFKNASSVFKKAPKKVRDTTVFGVLPLNDALIVEEMEDARRLLSDELQAGLVVVVLDVLDVDSFFSVYLLLELKDVSECVEMRGVCM